jgi:hypothetical protein
MAHSGSRPTGSFLLAKLGGLPRFMLQFGAQSALRTWLPCVGAARIHGAASSPVDHRSPGLVLRDLHGTRVMPLHRNQGEKHGRWELHGEAVAHRCCRGVCSRRWLLGGWWGFGGGPILHKVPTVVRKQS